MSAWRAESIEELAVIAERIVADTASCACPDEPHQNAMHDLAHDLSAFLDITNGQANTCRHDSATGIDTALVGPGKVWRCDHCGLTWTQDAPPCRLMVCRAWAVRAGEDPDKVTCYICRDAPIPPEADFCHEFIETGDCDHTDAEHDAMQTRVIPPGAAPSVVDGEQR